MELPCFMINILSNYNNHKCSKTCMLKFNEYYKNR